MSFPPLTNDQIFERRIKVDANGCWIWQGVIAWNGYGQFHSRRACPPRRSLTE